MTKALCLRMLKWMMGNETHYRWQVMPGGQLIEQQDCFGLSTTLTYDDWGQLRSLTNALQNETTTYTFSEQGFVVAHECLPDGTENRYDYDATGRSSGNNEDAGERHILLKRRNRRKASDSPTRSGRT